MKFRSEEHVMASKSKAKAKRTGPSKRTRAERDAINKRAAAWKPPAKPKQAKAPRPRPIINMPGQPTRWPREIKQNKIVPRRDMGDLEALARSFNDRGGMLHPIPIDKDNEQIAGQRRLAAWRLPSCKFHKEPIPVHVVDIDSILAGERDENEQRKDFVPSENVELYRALEVEARARAKERQAHGKTAPGKKLDASASGGEEKGEVADLIASYRGISRQTLTRAKEVVEAAERDPARFGPLVEQMDKTRNVNGPWRRLQVHNQVADINARKANGTLAVPEGKFDRIVADMPWPYEVDDETPAERGRAVRGYATMSIKEMKALPIAQRCADNTVLYFWVTNFHMEYAYQVMRAWGFAQFPTIITWTKDKFGKGQRLRCATEHCIIAIKGKPIWNLTNQTTRLDGPVREDSRKPDEFYALIDAITPAERSLEMFARRELPEGWVGFGDQVGTLKDEPTKAPENITENIIEAVPEEFAELQALETIEAGRDIDIKMPIVALLKEQKLARGSVKLKLTKAGMQRVEALRKEAYASTDDDAKSFGDHARLLRAGEHAGHILSGTRIGELDGDPQWRVECSCEGWSSVALETPEGLASQRISIETHLRAVCATSVALRTEAEEKTADRGSKRAKRPPKKKAEQLDIEELITGVDCRVCSDGNGLCAECLAAGEHVISHTNPDGMAIAECSCGWRNELPWGSHGFQDQAIKAHWQNVVTEAKAAAASEPAADPMDIPPRLRRAPIAEAAE
jgi:N6-adenosine-specific RNA methylase IME4